MNRQTVNSTDIASIGYDEITEILEIEFNSGAVYQYFNVPSNVYANLMAASSHGKFFTQNIKNVYQYSKV